MSEGLPLREEVPVKETWDLKDLFTSDQAFYQTLEQVVQMSLDFNHTYYQKLNNI
ncbi:MAG: M3 family oligoendopeptidase F, partial [Staphylococcus sp. DORA_6_22]